MDLKSGSEPESSSAKSAESEESRLRMESASAPERMEHSALRVHHIPGKPPGGYLQEDRDRRLRWLKKCTGVNLEGLPLPKDDELPGIIESHVGYMPLPMSIASPLVIQGTYASGEFAVPLATLEGTLTLSMTRGLLAIAMGGGCKAVHLKQELSRSPAFILPGILETHTFQDWVRTHLEPIRQTAEQTTQHGRLLRIDLFPIQNWVILDFVYDTGNAAGQNMVTIATDAACKWISSETGYPYYLESGFNSDKKPSRRTLSAGRGHSVSVEAHLSKEVLDFLGITAKAVLDFQQLAVTTAQAIGILGNNLHVANALTPIYLATGQDTACVAENAVAFTQATADDAQGLTIRITLPSLTVGTVGGGTRLPAQQRNLVLLGCHTGRHAARKLAEILAGSALALELSLMAAVVSGTFASAHQKYGRKSR